MRLFESALFSTEGIRTARIKLSGCECSNSVHGWISSRASGFSPGSNHCNDRRYCRPAWFQAVWLINVVQQRKTVMHAAVHKNIKVLNECLFYAPEFSSCWGNFMQYSWWLARSYRCLSVAEGFQWGSVEYSTVRFLPHKSWYVDKFS